MLTELGGSRMCTAERGVESGQRFKGLKRAGLGSVFGARVLHYFLQF